jgi:two-component system OmpR family sensor kinase
MTARDLACVAAARPRFAGGDSSCSRAAGRTGLELSIVDAVVAAPGGSAHVDSGPRRTVFAVWLPTHS